MNDQPPAHGCTIGGQPAIPVLLSEYQQLTAELAALARVRDAAALHRKGLISTAELYAVIGPAQAGGHDNGPSVREAAADDRRWPLERHGE